MNFHSGYFMYSDKDGHITLNSYNYYFSGAWSGADAQYHYFSDKNNGFTDHDVLTIHSSDEIENVLSENNIKKGDLLFWSSDDGRTVGHSTMINDVTSSDILFTGHTNPAFDKSVADTMKKNGQTVLIVRLNDYF